MAFMITRTLYRHKRVGTHVYNQTLKNQIRPDPSSFGSPSHEVEYGNLVLKRRSLRHMFPEFLPDPEPRFRNKVAEKLNRKDMIKRREMVELPEFYVGSIVAVTVADPTCPGENKFTRFLGIVMDRGGSGLRAWIILRNVIDGQGIEIMYELYNPTIQKVEVIRLETRLDNELYYLRDADPKHSTFPLDMDSEILPQDQKVPLNDEIIKLRPEPWTRRWERYIGRLKGFEFGSPMDDQTAMRWRNLNSKNNLRWYMETDKYDLLKHYLETIPVEQQDEIWAEVGEDLERRDKAMRKVAAQKAFSKPIKAR